MSFEAHLSLRIDIEKLIAAREQDDVKEEADRAGTNDACQPRALDRHVLFGQRNVLRQGISSARSRNRCRTNQPVISKTAEIATPVHGNLSGEFSRFERQEWIPSPVENVTQGECHARSTQRVRVLDLTGGVWAVRDMFLAIQGADVLKMSDRGDTPDQPRHDRQGGEFPRVILKPGKRSLSIDVKKRGRREVWPSWWRR